MNTRADARAEAASPPAQHTAVRPSWKCSACDTDWPCDAARAHLDAECGADRVQLAVSMAIDLQHAVGDLPPEAANPTDLYHRFIAWTRPVPLDADAPWRVSA